MAFVQINWDPSRSMLRSFGWIAIAGFGLLGAMAKFHFGLGHFLSEPAGAPVAYVMWGLAVLCGICAATAPTLLKPLFIGLTLITFPIGFVVSYVAVTAIFFLIITPVGLVFRLIGRDALTRRFEPAAATYWIRRNPPQDVKRYFRQF